MTNPSPAPQPQRKTREASLRSQIGNRIRELRKERGWSQRDLAARANLSHHRLSKYENGHQAPLGALIRIARSLGILVDVLLPDTGDLPRDEEDAQLLGRIRRLAALGGGEKAVACGLLDVVLAMRLLLRGPGAP
jgi:transcriptional regulator with XRE-family HTH domain